MTAPQEQSEPAYMDAMPLAAGPDAMPETAPDAGFSQDAAAKYDAVMAFCLTRGQVLFTTLMTEFVNIHLGDLERYSLQGPYKTGRAVLTHLCKTINCQNTGYWFSDWCGYICMVPTENKRQQH